MDASPRHPEAAATVEDRVVVVAEVLGPDLVALCAELRAAGSEVVVTATDDVRVALTHLPDPGCVIVDLRDGSPAREFLDAYCIGEARRVLAVTALADSAARVHAIECGIADDVVAPFDVAEAVARAQRILVGWRHLHARTLIAGDLHIDLALGQVQRAGENVDVTARELSVLVLLVKESPRVLSKQELLARVWHGAERTPNLVEATVSSLRRKLERLGPRVLHTQHGVGYSFRALTVAAGGRHASALERERLVRERDALIAQRDRTIASLREQLERARAQAR